jgi:AcrR family transcriptional regulator
VSDGRTKRPYDSRRRQAQAARTRLEILQAARLRFERDGYVATTMEAIAGEADVALKTVYASFTTKAGLLRAVWDLGLKGDTDDAPVADREWYRAALAEPDGERQLRLIAHNSCIVKRRIGPLLRVIRSAAEVDADGAALWQLIQSDFHSNQRALIDTLASRGGLREGLDAVTATDILWTLNHPNVWLLLVVDRGWSPEKFETWFGDTLVAQLARPGR